VATVYRGNIDVRERRNTRKWNVKVGYTWQETKQPQIETDRAWAEVVKCCTTVHKRLSYHRGTARRSLV